MKQGRQEHTVFDYSGYDIFSGYDTGNMLLVAHFFQVLNQTGNQDIC
jgi:hypothetical protein